VTRLPFTVTWPWRTNWRAWEREAPQPAPVRDVVEAQLEELEQVRARDAGATVGLLRRGCGTASPRSRRYDGLLLLSKLGQVLRTLALTVAAVHARREGAGLAVRVLGDGGTSW